MSGVAENKKQLEWTVIVVSLLGLAVAAMWLVVGLSSLSMQVGWYVHLALAALAWLQLVHVDRTSKLNRRCGHFLWLQLCAGWLPMW